MTFQECIQLCSTFARHDIGTRSVVREIVIPRIQAAIEELLELRQMFHGLGLAGEYEAEFSAELQSYHEAIAEAKRRLGEAEKA